MQDPRSIPDPTETPAIKKRGPPQTPAEHIAGNLCEYDPCALPPPRADPQLPTLSALERSAEVIRFTGAKLEYTVSRGGELRAWVLCCLRLALYLGIPALLAWPLLRLLLRVVTVLLHVVFNMLLLLILCGLFGLGVVLIGAVCRRRRY